jgi:hypothetical protein
MQNSDGMLRFRTVSTEEYVRYVHSFIAPSEVATRKI